jgi:hypothetical protein
MSTIKLFTLGFMCLVMSCLGVKACNLSSLTLVSVTGTGPYVISVNLCVGTGLTLLPSATKGADQSTTHISFGFWDATPGFAVSAFTPAQMFSIAPAQATTPPRCRLNGVNIGPVASHGTSVTIFYQMPTGAPCTGTNATNYGCINSAAICGPATQNCSTHTFTVNQMPDSMRAFGVEGAGNQIGGCYPNADMKIDFSTFAVQWGVVEGIRSTTGINIKWTTLEEINADYFIVERSGDGLIYESIGEVTAVGNASTASRYAYMDHSPVPGANYYRIVEVDRAGGSIDSETIEVQYSQPDGLQWGAVGPNPAADFVQIAFFAPDDETMSLQLLDVTGKVVLASVVEATLGGNEVRLDLSQLARGNYFLTLRGAQGKLTRKLVKL